MIHKSRPGDLRGGGSGPLDPPASYAPEVTDEVNALKADSLRAFDMVLHVMQVESVSPALSGECVLSFLH